MRLERCWGGEGFLKLFSCLPACQTLVMERTGAFVLFGDLVRRFWSRTTLKVQTLEVNTWSFLSFPACILVLDKPTYIRGRRTHRPTWAYWRCICAPCRVKSILHKLHQSYEKHNPASEDSQYKSGSHDIKDSCNHIHYYRILLLTRRRRWISFRLWVVCVFSGERRKSRRWLQAPKLTNKQMEMKEERL